MASKAAIVVLIPSTGEVGGAWASTATPTRKLHGLTDSSFSVTSKTEVVPMVGYYGASPISDEVQRGAEFQMDGVWSYQEAPKYLNGFFTYTSQSTAAAAPYDYYWSAPVASTQACATYRFEFGPSSNEAYASVGSIFNSLKVSAETGSYWKFSIGGFAKLIETCTGLTTAAWADARAMKPVAMKDTAIRMSPFATGAYGTSSGELSASLISFELNYDPKRHLKYFAGSVEAQGWGDDRSEATLRVVLEYKSTAKAAVDAMLKSSTSTTSTGVTLQRQIQIYASSTSTASSTGFVSAIDFAGVLSQPIKLWNDRDGNLTLDLTFAGKFTTAMSCVGSSELGNYLAFRVTNDSSSTT